MINRYKQDWERKELNTIGFDIEGYIKRVVQKQIPEYADFFPFKTGYTSKSYSEGDFFCFQMEEIFSQMPHIGNLENKDLIEICKNLFTENHFPSYEETYRKLGQKGFSFKLFTYVGEKKEKKLSWQHIAENITKWLIDIVLPEVIKRNTKRVTDVIPPPPNYDTTKILNNTYVIESESGMLQGTAFHLKGIGVITCDHCIRDEESQELLTDLKLYRGNDFKNNITVTIEHFNSEIDIAILKVDNDFLYEGLERGNADNIEQMNHIAVAGFPNYSFGDNGIFTPGLAVGFRTYSGIRHILVNTPLISGNSGGPAIDKNNQVIGLAVTGAEKMSKAHETEKHGIIPINVIDLIIK